MMPLLHHSMAMGLISNGVKQTALIIGLVVAITVVVAIIVIAVSTFVMKWKKKKEYDLLD